MSRRPRARWTALLLALLGFEGEAPGRSSLSQQEAEEAEVLPAPGRLGAVHEEALTRHLERYEPLSDGWRSEEWSERVNARMKALLGLWKEGGAPGPAALAPFALEEVSITGLPPAELTLIRESAAFRVRRAGPAAEPARGLAALDEALGWLGRSLGGGGFRASLKVESVEEQGRELWVRMRYHAAGPGQGRAVEHNDLWAARLLLDEEGFPRLLALESQAFELVEGPAAGGTLFSDCTLSAFAGVEAFDRQLRIGHGQWQRRLAHALGVSVLGDQGLAIADVDGDGLEDLYLCEPGGLPDRLLRHRPDGTLEDISAQAGVDVLDMTSAALLVDLDNDGDPDLVLAAAIELLVLENDGSGRFELRAGLEVTTPMSLCAADVDLDGDLDLYVCGYFSPYEDQNAPIPYHDARNGAPNRLFRNLGELRFEDATAELGLEHNNDRFSFAAAFEDYDGDGWPDLYVANDFGRNNLYRNLGGRFVDVAAEAGVEDISAGMGVSWGDYDGDGLLDLYVSNMDSKAGRRIAYQRLFRPTGDETSLPAYRRHARGNSLFRNLGDKGFLDVSEEAGVTRGLWSWGSLFLDLDCDGRLDLCVPNGFVTNERYDDL